MKSLTELETQLKKLDMKSYRALKDIQGSYAGDQFRLHLDYVQGDPFAAPSRLRLEMNLKDTPVDPGMLTTESRTAALKHLFTKQFESIRRKTENKTGGTGKSGMIMIDTPGREVLDTTSVYLTENTLEFRISCGLPAKGRKILGGQCATLLTNVIPSILSGWLKTYDHSEAQAAVTLSDDQDALRRQLAENGLVSFIADGSILPRRSGSSTRPMKEGAVPFKAPDSLRVTLKKADGSSITGLGIRQGITLIAGGGYHGKSTLLQAVELGVYNHEEGDGREYTVSDASGVKIRAEDGREVRRVNISPFINELPMKKRTDSFSSTDASGSTSQAANIMEALEAGAESLFIDEDTSATNFMIRDARMQRLVVKEKEPITPFIDRIRDLYEQKGVSTVLVLGGSGDYFDVADTVIMMDEYVPHEVTERAKEIAQEYETKRSREAPVPLPDTISRDFEPSLIKQHLDRKGKIQARGLHQISIGREPLPLHSVEQLVHPSQTEALALMLKKLERSESGSLTESIRRIYKEIEEKGIDSLSPFYGKHPGAAALPRFYEACAAINRIRSRQR
ncbi:ABC-ATPase domain-containing protein [Alkalicoccus urumqiensis]|uniref:ATPase n=1 Tax=Alkalicoccus urumqiensis TaxID=1548213 RepID=A0A2P6MKS1_ALKUR|nr:ABC-ATPase domain-containing protein [Alkalicoccus urumqiensis]PRO66886.1 ATPase [Alkalicoccus urumqiensis]